MSEESNKSGIKFTFKPRQFKVPLPSNKSSRDAQQQQQPTSSPNLDNKSSNATPSTSPRTTMSPSTSSNSSRTTMSPSTSNLFKEKLHSLSGKKKQSSPNLSNQSIRKQSSFTEPDNKSQQSHGSNNNTAQTKKNKATGTGTDNNKNKRKPKVIEALDEKLNSLQSFTSRMSNLSIQISLNKKPNGPRTNLPDVKMKGKPTTSFTTSNQLKRTFSQPNLSLSAANQPEWSSTTFSARAKKTGNSLKNTRRDSPLIDSLPLTKIKREPSLVTINDSEEDTIDAIQTSYKKRLGNKERANTEAKAKIEELEEFIKQQQLRIHQLEEDEKLNIKVMEYNLASYTRDKKRIDALTEDVECFKCIFHSLKSMLETAQKSKEESEDDFHKLSRIFQEERSTQANIVEKCKNQFEKLSGYYKEDFQEIFTALSLQTTQVHEHMDGLKSFLLDDLLQQQQDREAQKKSQDKGINNLQVILKEFKDASKDIDEFVSKFKEDKIYVDSVLSMCEANKLSSIEVYNVSRELEADFMDMEKEFEMLKKESEILQKELSVSRTEKESLERKVIELTRSNESVKSDLRSELFKEQQDEAYEMLDLQNSLMKLKNEQLVWQIEKRELTDQIWTLKEENDRSKQGNEAVSIYDDNLNITPTQSISDSLLYGRNLNGNNRIPRVITVADSSEDRDTRTEDDDPVITRGSGNFTRLSLSRRESSAGRRAPVAAIKYTGSQNSLQPSNQQSSNQQSKQPSKVQAMKDKSGETSSNTATTSKYWEDQKNTAPSTNRKKYNTRRSSSRKRSMPPSSDDENVEEVTNNNNNDESPPNQQQQNKKRRKIRKLPGGSNEVLDDSDDADMSKKINKAMAAVSIPEGAKDAHLKKKKQ